MNYLKELNAFYNQIIFNPLSGSAVALWNTLMHFNNLCGWQKTFTVPASAIELKSGIKGTSFKRARQELQEKGYIHVTPGSGNQAATYGMISQVRHGQESEFAGQEAPETRPEETEPVREEYCPEMPAAADQEAQPQTNDASKDQFANELSQHVTKTSLNTRQDAAKGDNNAVGWTDWNSANRKAINEVHSTAPLFKQYINKNKTKHKPTTTPVVQFYRGNFDKLSAYGEPENFVEACTKLEKAFKLVKHTDDALPFADEVTLYQMVRIQVKKYLTSQQSSPKADQTVEERLNAMIDRHLETKEPVDIYQVAGIEKPDISILDEDFFERHGRKGRA
ncbi:protein of unknown function [Lentibacillus persicus]|uniref:Type I restriction enzyme HindI endonuclease subunit-like C-terminal domain-containing protein n=1 Tax=Lentibacillus persicus TaxID=640948 RepID=A0A1I1TSL8_9BACI|nr:type I restriction enzyme endonuclease domain-containing protein [Lentibacillus persicus]SFD61365.1 protein of unknown function [Lentibacillus persicus]